MSFSTSAVESFHSLHWQALHILPPSIHSRNVSLGNERVKRERSSRTTLRFVHNPDSVWSSRQERNQEGKACIASLVLASRHQPFRGGSLILSPFLTFTIFHSIPFVKHKPTATYSHLVLLPPSFLPFSSSHLTIAVNHRSLDSYNKALEHQETRKNDFNQEEGRKHHLLLPSLVNPSISRTRTRFRSPVILQAH